MSPELLKQIQLASTGQQTTSIRDLGFQFIKHTREHCAKSTVYSRQSRIGKLIVFLESAGIHDLSQVNNSVLAIYFNQCAESCTVSTVNATKKTVKSFFNWIDQCKEMDTPVRVDNIAMGKEGKRHPRYINSDEVNKVINCRQIAYVDRLLTAVNFGLGLRASELSNIRMGDIHDTDQLRVIGKGNVERSVTIPSSVLAMIELYTNLSPYELTPDSYLFQSFWRGEWRKMDAKTIWRRLKTVFLKVCGIDMSPHWLRHSYAVDLLSKGCDLVTIQKSLGHTDIKVTQTYLNIGNEIVSQQIHKFLG